MILHVMTFSIYTTRYIEFISENKDLGNHIFYVSGLKNKYDDRANLNVHSLSSIASIKSLLTASLRAKGILLHQLNQPVVLILLAIFNPRMTKKLGWVIWGGDLSFFISTKKGIKSKLVGLLYGWVIPRIPFIVAHIPGDYQLLNASCELKADYLCAKYPGSTEKIQLVERECIDNKTVSIMVGNSGDQSNRHVEAFEYLKQYNTENIAVHAVLSYGYDQDYIDNVVAIGKSIFKRKFFPHLKFMPYDLYLDLLSTIDICVFYHDRQQGMGNLNMFFGLGAKVYLSEKVTTFDYYTSLGIDVFPTESISNLPFESFKYMDRNEKKKNSILIGSDMDRDEIKAGWSRVFSCFNSLN